MKSSSHWLSQYKEAWRPSGVYIWDRSILSPQNLTAAGYPADLLPDQALGTLLARDVAQLLPNGRYIVTYDGDGELVFGTCTLPRVIWARVGFLCASLLDPPI
jgi:hypothetical protein